VISLVKINDFI